MLLTSNILAPGLVLQSKNEQIINNSFKINVLSQWMSRNSSHHQMFGSSEIKAQVNQQWDFLKSALLLWFNHSQNQNSNQCKHTQTDIYYKGKKTVLKNKIELIFTLQNTFSRLAYTQTKKSLKPDHYYSPADIIKNKNDNVSTI